MASVSMDNWQNEILARLKKYSNHKVIHDDVSVSVTCENPQSDEVSIWKTDECFQVNFASWHEHFDDLEDALNCFVFCLSEKCRLKVTFRGNMECAWTLQSRETGDWQDVSKTGLIFIPFWKSKTVEFRHNVLSKRSETAT